MYLIFIFIQLILACPLLFQYIAPIIVSCCAGWSDIADQKIATPLLKENIMSKNQKTNKENKKTALMTAKEKKAAKKLKKEKTGLFTNEIKL